MGKFAKIAISLPADMLEAIERERKVKGESRSEFLRRAAEAALLQDKERNAVASYVRGYRKTPESADEIASAHRAGSAILATEPWE